MITKEMLVASKTCTSDIADKWVSALNAACDKYEINTPNRIAGFLSQVGHESGGFQTLVENLNYSSHALMTVNGFAGHFTQEEADSFQRQPERIANRAYANRNGNGDEASGEGWKYRGQGPIQLTGKDNMAGFFMESGIDVLTHPELLQQPDAGAMSAGWFWSMKHLNALADAGDVVGMTKKVNGGLNGLDDRQMRYARIQDYFKSQA